MKNLLTLLFVFGISIFSLSQTAGNYVYEKIKNTPTNFGGPGGKNVQSLNSKTLTIEASALMNIVPDAQIVVFTIVQLGGSAQEATELIDSKLNPIRAGLNQIGISNSNIVVDMISFIPRYEDTVVKKKFSKTFTEIPKGFELKKNIHIKFKDHELIDKIEKIILDADILASLMFGIDVGIELARRLKHEIRFEDKSDVLFSGFLSLLQNKSLYLESSKKILLKKY